MLLRSTDRQPIDYPREGPGDTAFLFDAFLDWVAGRRNDHPTSVDDNLDCMALLFTANTSADRGEGVDALHFLNEAQAST